MAKGNNNVSGRRSHGGKPYDLNNSFVKKVATKVTDFMPQRSWISKWFNNSEDNGEVLNDSQNAECEETTEEEQQAPPAKRPRIRMDVIHPPGTFNIHLRNKSALNKHEESKEQFPNHNETNEDFLEPLAAGPSGLRRLVSSTPAIQNDVRGVTTQRSDLNSLNSVQDNGVINGADDNSESSESTSGCSSLIPQNNRQEAPSNASFASSFVNKKRFMDDKMNYTNQLQSPRSLFLDTSNRDSLSSRRPSFNSSIMSNTLERSSSLASPFYSGNVTFGGANAAGLYKRSRSLFSSNNEYKLKVPRRTNIQVKPSNNGNIDSSGMSQTAKRILEALEHYSSPVLDAKKIPIRNASNLTNSGSKKRPREEISNSSPRIGLRHMTRQLTVPTVPDLLKIRRRQRLQDTTLAARNIVSANSAPAMTVPSEYRLRTDADDDLKFRGKLRVKSKTNALEEETVEPVNLPTIALPISTLPRFDIALPQYTKPHDRSIDKENSFKFASPIKVTNSMKSFSPISDFTFSKPLNPTDTNDLGNDLNSSSKTLSLDSNESSLSFNSAPNFMWSGTTAPRPKEKSTVKEPTVPKPANELKSGSVVDFLKELGDKTQKSEKTENKKVVDSTSEVEVLSSVTKRTESWECSECLIRNDSTATHCTACKSVKSGNKVKELPKLSSTSQIKPVENDCFGSKFKLSSDQWECGACLVRNKQTADKCVSCMTPKPGDKLVNSGVESDLLKKFKPAGDSWECPGCMVRNNGSVSTCPCCTTPKPSSKDDSKKGTSQASSLQMNNKSWDNLKSSKSTWECPCCMVRNVDTVTVCPCCKAVKPGSTISSMKKPEEPALAPLQGFGDKFKQPAGAWTCDSCLVSNKSDASECIACASAKPGTEKAPPSSSGSSLQFSFGAPPKDCGFKFGINNADAKPAEPASGFVFGTKPATTSTENFTFGLKKTDQSEAPKASGFTFGEKNTDSSKVEPDAEKKVSESKSTFTFGVPKTEEKKPEVTEKVENTEKKAEKSFSFGVASSTATASPTASGFKFVASSSKRPAEDESQAKKPAPVQASLTPSPFSGTVTSSQTVTSNPNFSFTSSPSVAAKPISSTTTETTTTTAATSLPSFSNATPTFSFSDQSKSKQPATLPSFGAPASSPISTFSFGGSKPETTTSTEKKPLASFSSTTPNFGSPSTAPPFGKSESTPLPAFATLEKKPSLFGSQETKAPGFGDKETKPPPAFGTQDKSVSGFGGSNTPAPLFPSAAPSFGSSTATSPFTAPAPAATPLFGNTSTPSFGSPSASVFSVTKPNDGEKAAPSAGLFTFGSSQPATTGFNFSAGNSAPATTAQKAPVFAFGAGTSTTQAGSSFGGNSFSTSTPAAPAQTGFSFNSPKPEASSTFGQTAPTPAPLFGATQPAQSSFSAAGTPNAGFNFGGAAPAAPPSGGFNFGGMPAATTPAQPNSGFNFTAPNPMSFNFTGGNQPTTFNATPQLQQQAQRKIKTARRRITPR